MTRFIPAATPRTRRITRSGLAAMLATTALLGTIACSGGGDTSTGPRNNENPVGTFALFQVNQKNIPKVIFQGPYTFPGGATYNEFVFTITGGEMILQENGDIHVAIDYKAAADGNELTGSRKADGTYEVNGNQISISSGDGGVDGTYRNGVITLQLDLLGDGELQTYTFRYVP